VKQTVVGYEMEKHQVQEMVRILLSCLQLPSLTMLLMQSR
jgi:Holliday junction resolvasome RuvABC endonuclease subunit